MRARLESSLGLRQPYHSNASANFLGKLGLTNTSWMERVGPTNTRGASEDMETQGAGKRVGPASKTYAPGMCRNVVGSQKKDKQQFLREVLSEISVMTSLRPIGFGHAAFIFLRRQACVGLPARGSRLATQGNDRTKSMEVALIENRFQCA